MNVHQARTGKSIASGVCTRRKYSDIANLKVSHLSVRISRVGRYKFAVNLESSLEASRGSFERRGRNTVVRFDEGSRSDREQDARTRGKIDSIERIRVGESPES